MKIHKEGYKTIAWSVILFTLVNLISFYAFSYVVPWLSWLIFLVSFLLLLLIVYFFRSPQRHFVRQPQAILSPADGKIVALEKIFDDEFFKDKRIQISVFMSPLNVHLNRIPVSGKVIYSRYHPGKYLMAWHPKSSTENERHTVVIETSGKQIMIKQIAGFLARRIINYLKPGMEVAQAQELGFIKFGSRVDILIPKEAVIKVKNGDQVKAGLSVIAEW
ncbi:MAG: phosphatidylserine decarboxylase family protein [Chitinophagaceae bacterium]|nr:phosphatidylserine decarboxylase family protein [Chitinophagaceae bacterium]